MDRRYDVVVVGGGHAGLEAAAAAARMGAATAIVTLAAAALGRMSCNPAIGGIGKGQLAREVDALGGWMGLLADRAGIQFRQLNTRKGLAVRSPRAQCDRQAYETAARELAAAQENLEVLAGEVVDLLWEGGGRRIAGVLLGNGRRLAAGAVVLTTGTFLEGVLHTGLQTREGGRLGEDGARRLGEALRALGLPTARLKTGTPPRLAADGVDWSRLEEQPGDPEPVPFSFLTDSLPGPQVSCWRTRTTPRTHEIVRAHLHEAPMYAGRIQGRGPRYCPSLEDKVVRFGDRDGHTVFLEPEGRDSPLLYANGISTSLPPAVQAELVRTIPGLERARIVQPGYAVEYTHVAPRCLGRNLEVRERPGLFLAGQICGTSGYEEAAAQGIVAGINAVLSLDGREAFILGRDEAYIGVLVDDLVVSDPREPYRMFTSRAEHRLLLRADNADLRLTRRAAAVGAVDGRRLACLEARERRLEAARRRLEETPDPGSAGGGPRRSLADRLRRPGTALEEVLAALPGGVPELPPGDRITLEADLRYDGYIRRQRDWVARSAEREGLALPPDLDYGAIPGLRREAREALAACRPETLGAAARLPGVHPADVALLEVVAGRRRRSLSCPGPRARRR